jgi:hypothetical protein
VQEARVSRTSPNLLSGPRAVHAQQLRLATLVAIAQDEAAARRRRARRIWGVSVFVALSSVGIVFQSCAGSKSTTAAAGKDNQPLLFSGKKSASKKSAHDARDADESAEKPDKSTFDKAATDLQALFDAGTVGGAAAEPTDPGTPALQTDPASAPRPSSRRNLPPAPPTAHEPAQPTPAATSPETTSGASIPMSVEAALPATKTPEQRRAELTAELASLLRPDAANNPDVMQALSSLIALEAVQPGAATPEIEAALKPLSPDEAATARVARDIVRALSADSKLLGDAAALREELTRQLERLTGTTDAPAADTLSLETAALCTRVESFGRYTPYAGNRFLAGRTNPAIVYVEVDHFTQRAVSELLSPGLDTAHAGDEALAVELAMRAELYHDDGSRQWRSSEAVIRDTSRTRRRDFFLVQRIDLPSNLSVGKYNLKVTVRDRLAPGGGAEAEIAIPIQIIADAGLLGGSDPIPKTPAKPVLNAPVAGPEPLKVTPAAVPVASRPHK